MHKKTAKQKAGSLTSALFLGLIFGIFLVVCQELIYQYNLQAQYDGATQATVDGAQTANLGVTPHGTTFSQRTTRTEENSGVEEDEGPAGYRYDAETGNTIITLGEESITLDFAGLKEQNPDFTGWFVIPGTDVSYPVVQGTNNSFYLDHLFDGSYGLVGTLFADYRNMILEDENTIIYGHNFHQYGAMLSKLIYYEQQSWYEEHPVMYYLTEEIGYAIEVFSVFEAGTEDPVYTLTFSQSTDFESFASRVQGKSIVNTNVTVAPEDKVITMSTCSNRDSEGRFVVVGKVVPFSDD